MIFLLPKIYSFENVRATWKNQISPHERRRPFSSKKIGGRPSFTKIYEYDPQIRMLTDESIRVGVKVDRDYLAVMRSKGHSNQGPKATLFVLVEIPRFAAISLDIDAKMSVRIDK